MHRYGVKSAGLALSVVCVCHLLVATAAGQEQQATGLVVSLEGDVEILRGDESEPAAIGSVLCEGETLIVKPGAKCTGFTPAGSAFELQGPAELLLSSSADRSTLNSISDWVRIQLAQWIGESRRQPLATRTARDWEVQVLCPTPLVPAADGQVRQGRSRFLWTTIPGIDRYDLTLAPATGEELKRTVRGHRTAIGDLVPGEQYVWKVRPAIEDWKGESGWRAFRVMTPEEEKNLDQAIRKLDDLEAGVLLLSAGLHEEAVYRFDAALASIEDAPSAQVWRAQVLAEIGLYKEAYEDLAHFPR